MCSEKQCSPLFVANVSDINCIADRCPGVAKLTKEQFPQINHQYDLYHVEKGIQIKLTNEANERGSYDLYGRINAITSHLLYCCHDLQKDRLQIILPHMLPESCGSKDKTQKVLVVMNNLMGMDPPVDGHGPASGWAWTRRWMATNWRQHTSSGNE